MVSILSSGMSPEIFIMFMKHPEVPNMELRDTPIWKKRQELHQLQQRHHAEFVVLHRQMRKLIRQSALNCEHEFEFDSMAGLHCIICGISDEQYKHNRHYRGEADD